MSDRSPWLQGIVDKLANSLGTSEQKRTALWAAKEMEAQLPAGTKNAEAFAAMLRRMFVVWIDKMRYLVPEDRLDHFLPGTVMRSDAEVGSEYGLSSKAAITAKQEQISANRETRIARAVQHIDAGWIQEDALCFVAGRDEWQKAKERARRVAA